MSQSTAAVVRAYFDELEAGRFDAPLRHYAAHAVATMHGQLEGVSREALADHLLALARAASDLSVTVLELVSDGDTAAVRWRARGTFAGPGAYLGFAPTGASFDFEGVDVVHVSGGAIVRIDGYSDGATIARQLGLAPKAGSISERAMTAALNARTRVARMTRRLRNLA